MFAAEPVDPPKKRTACLPPFGWPECLTTTPRALPKLAVHPSGDPVLLVRLPELLASESSAVLGEALMERAASAPALAAGCLVSVTSRI